MDLSALSHPNERISERDYVGGAVRRFAYTAPLKIGSLEDEVRIAFQTTRNLFWVPTRNCDSYQFQNKRDTITGFYQCDSNGVYLPSKLTSFRNTGYLFHWWYSETDTGGASGYFGYDKVQYGVYSGNVTFGIATADLFGEIGLGFPDLQILDTDSTLGGVTFSQQLLENGDIKSNAFSFQLGINNASEGTLLLGAVDHSKYEGKLQKVKMVDLYTDGSDSILILLDGYLGDGFSSEMNISVLVTTIAG